MPRSVSSPAIAGLEFLTGFTETSLKAWGQIFIYPRPGISDPSKKYNFKRWVSRFKRRALNNYYTLS